MKPIRIFCLLLAVALFCMLAACTPTTPNTSDTTDTSPQTGSTEGLSAPTRYEQSSIPLIPDLNEWFEEARDREQLTNALIYSEEGDTWHCWLYVGCYAEGDKVSVTVSSDGVLLIAVTAADPEASGCRSVLYFTLRSSTEPDADITVNGSTDGILLTRADTALNP